VAVGSNYLYAPPRQVGGGNLILGYDLRPDAGGLLVNPAEAQRVREIFPLYRECGLMLAVVRELRQRGWPMKQWTNRAGEVAGGSPFNRITLRVLLTNPVCASQIRHRGTLYPGEHEPILDPKLWHQVQQQLSRRGTKRQHKPKPLWRAARKSHSLRGVRFRDDAYLVAQGADRVPLLHLHAFPSSRCGVCRTRSVSAPALEQAVLEQLQQLASAEGSPFAPFLNWKHLTATQRENTIMQFVNRVSFDGRSQRIRLLLYENHENNDYAE
jgi:hypothetical protein